MGKAETLLRIKEAEAQIRTAKTAAEQERERALRKARKEALDLLESYRNQAEERFREIVSAAEAAVAVERDRMLAAAREEAGRMSARGRANLDAAVRLVVEKFRGALRA